MNVIARTCDVPTDICSHPRRQLARRCSTGLLSPTLVMELPPGYLRYVGRNVKNKAKFVLRLKDDRERKRCHAGPKCSATVPIEFTSTIRGHYHAVFDTSINQAEFLSSVLIDPLHAFMRGKDAAVVFYEDPRMRMVDVQDVFETAYLCAWWSLQMVRRTNPGNGVVLGLSGLSEDTSSTFLKDLFRGYPQILPRYRMRTPPTSPSSEFPATQIVEYLFADPAECARLFQQLWAVLERGSIHSQSSSVLFTLSMYQTSELSSETPRPDAKLECLSVSECKYQTSRSHLPGDVGSLLTQNRPDSPRYRYAALIASDGIQGQILRRACEGKECRSEVVAKLFFSADKVDGSRKRLAYFDGIFSQFWMRTTSSKSLANRFSATRHLWTFDNEESQETLLPPQLSRPSSRDFRERPTSSATTSSIIPTSRPRTRRNATSAARRGLGRNLSCPEPRQPDQIGPVPYVGMCAAGGLGSIHHPYLTLHPAGGKVPTAVHRYSITLCSMDGVLFPCPVYIPRCMIPENPIDHGRLQSSPERSFDARARLSTSTEDASPPQFKTVAKETNNASTSTDPESASGDFLERSLTGLLNVERWMSEIRPQSDTETTTLSAQTDGFCSSSPLEPGSYVDHITPFTRIGQAKKAVIKSTSACNLMSYRKVEQTQAAAGVLEATAAEAPVDLESNIFDFQLRYRQLRQGVDIIHRLHTWYANSSLSDDSSSGVVSTSSYISLNSLGTSSTSSPSMVPSTRASSPVSTSSTSSSDDTEFYASVASAHRSIQALLPNPKGRKKWVWSRLGAQARAIKTSIHEICVKRRRSNSSDDRQPSRSLQPTSPRSLARTSSSGSTSTGGLVSYPDNRR